jgi:uncharacterized protein
VSAAFAAKYGPLALVTGAAQGIGRALCEEIASRGVQLIAADVQAAALRQTAERLRATGTAVEEVVVDLSRDDSTQRLIDAVGRRELGLLVCCAAQIPSGAFLDAERTTHERALAVNARSPMLLAHAFAPAMRARRRGGILLVSSMAALQGTGWVATYAATKAFEMILAESLWWELKDDGVDVLAVLPGVTDTEGLRRHSPYIEDPSALARPRDVAIEALDALGRSPSWICGEANRGLAEAMRSLSREQAIDMVSRGTRRMADGPKG